MTAPAIGQEAYALDSPTIHGTLDDGTAATLWIRGFSPLQPRRRSGEGEQRWKRVISVAVLGAHLRDIDTERFAGSALRFENLAMWSRHPLTVDEAAPDPQFESATFDPYGDGTEVIVSVDHPQVVRRRASGHASITAGSGDAAEIAFSVDRPKSLDFHDHIAHDCQGLLTFCFQARAHLSEQYLFHEETRLRVYRRRSVRALNRRLHGSQMIITANTTAPSLLISAWWRVTRELYPVPQVLAGRHYTRSAFLEGHVVSAIAALERVYEHLPLPQVLMDSEVFRQRKDWHQAAEADASFREMLGWLENRPTLRRKLKAVRELLGDALLNTAGVSGQAWINEVMSVRNALAHTGSHVSGVDETGADLLDRVDAATRTVLTLILCRALGLSGHEVDRAAGVLGHAAAARNGRPSS